MSNMSKLLKKEELELFFHHYKHPPTNKKEIPNAIVKKVAFSFNGHKCCINSQHDFIKEMTEVGCYVYYMEDEYLVAKNETHYFEFKFFDEYKCREEDAIYIKCYDVE